MAAIVELDISDPEDVLRAREALSSAVCAIGVFDGVHLGHAFLIGKAISKAREKGVSAVVITFDIDPDEHFAGSSMKKLMSNSRRISVLSGLDIDTVVVLRFCDALAAMAPDDFLDAIFAGSMPSAIYVGEDFRFGRGAEGDFQAICDWAAENADGELETFAAELMVQDGEPITSTRIRRLLAEGELQKALELLGHPYLISGDIVHGRGQGTGFGMSTADLQIPDDLMVLSDGVYAAYAHLGNNADALYEDAPAYMAAVSVGIPPTFEDTAKANVEAHLLDFSGDIYGEVLTLDMRSYLRPMRKFDSIDALMDAIRSDIDKTRSSLS